MLEDVQEVHYDALIEEHMEADHCDSLADWDSREGVRSLHCLSYPRDGCGDCGSVGNGKGAWSTVPSLKKPRTVDETL